MPESVKAAWIPYGRTLRRLRTQAGMSCRALAAEAACAESLVSKIENGYRRVSGQVNNQLGTALQTQVPHAARRLTDAHHKAREASQHSWFNDIADLEAASETIELWEPLLIPGIYQTAAYATQVFTEGRPHASTHLVSQHVGSRMERARVACEKETWAILDETVLYRNVGGHQVMADQLNHLSALASRRNRITIVPRDAPYSGGLAGSIILLSDHNRVTAYVEHTAGGDIIHDPDEIARISSVWKEISAWGLSPADSIRAIETATKHHQEQAA